MELKNIHTRRDFIKTNEGSGLFGNKEGGVGSDDGFANNDKLKDTYLGKLLNGIFSGIGNLWRKSKENFIINRLIAQLVNELLRGIILFCFANNISLKEGKQTSTEVKKEGEEGKKEGEGEGDEENKDTEQEETETMSKEELVEEIKSYRKVLNENYNELGYAKSRLGKAENELRNLVNPKEKIAKQEQIDKLKIKYSELEKSIKQDEEDLAKLKERLKKVMGVQQKPQQQQQPQQQQSNKFEKIDKSCKDKYQFNPLNANLPDEAIGDLETMPYPNFTNRFTKIKSKYIKVGEKFSAVIDNVLRNNVKITSVNIPDKIVEYEVGGKKGSISTFKLLPNGFPSIVTMKKDSFEEFLNKYIDNYDSMSDDNKRKMEQVYMNYTLLNMMIGYQKSPKVTESVEFITEDSLVRNVGQTLAHSSGSAKVKPDEPKAGQVGLGKAIAMKAGASANVGNILTKRDREKYKDKEEEFGLNIHDLNLAEIEKTVEQMDNDAGKEKNVKAIVSSYVNPYNLKTIQISAEQLIGKSAEDGKENNALRLRWNKEVTNTYAAFTNIMDIEKVNIIGEYGKDLDSAKVEKLGKESVNKLQAQQKSAQLQSTLPLEPGSVNFNGMKDGLWCYYSFTYSSKLYNTSIAPVAYAFNQNPGVGLFQITASFDIDSENKVTTNNAVFDAFSSNSSVANKTPESINVFFLIKSGKNFPTDNSTRSLNFKVFVLNEFVYNDGTKTLFLKKKGSLAKPTNIILDKNMLNSNFNSAMFIHDVDTIDCTKFSKTKFDDTWKNAFNISDKTDYHGTNKPSFLENDIIEVLQKLDPYLK